MAKVWKANGRHSIDLQCRPGRAERDSVSAGEMSTVFPAKGLVLLRPLCQRLTAAAIRLDGALKGVNENVRVFQNMAALMMSVQVKTQLLPPVSPAETMTHRTQAP
jgi:hypothetical protein